VLRDLERGGRGAGGVYTTQILALPLLLAPQFFSSHGTTLNLPRFLDLATSLVLINMLYFWAPKSKQLLSDYFKNVRCLI
jgi:hypothetical protein